jgi:1,4-alpha-glucan branching enzyme
MERAFAQLVTTMQEITNECKEGDVTFCEHATSHMRVLACNIHNICLTKANVVSHPGLVLHHVENGLGNSVKWLKDWHETTFNHTNVRIK